jgi:hypothetical protein
MRRTPRHRLVRLRGAHRELWYQPALLEEEEEEEAEAKAEEAEEEAAQEGEEARCLIAMTRTQALVWNSASRRRGCSRVA